ncbi:hypothetical protein HUN08_12940 [Gordonia sp. X0973]|uniref:hypothetical protein n=1 Tax=Gordonia sp. X0973 TaxID=2742602 RepID=UPI000F51F764|nr:hypothetical protein [Gordonia sp. X0973]QKT07988.1 hypothetical protein HUN08_12940 [Gordonia sp. X0973]
MPGYGRSGADKRRVRFAAIAAALLAATTAAVAVSSCSIVSDLATPDKSRTIVVPGTDPLTTESAVPSSSVGVSEAMESDSASGQWDDWSYGHLIGVAPRVDIDRFHRAAKTPTSPLVTTTGFHFSTPDRGVQCSTGANGTGTLSCVSKRVNGPPAPPGGTPSSCAWNPSMATLGPAGASAGACANLYPVMTRSSILPSRQTLSVGRFKCLDSTEGLYCLQSTGTGFALSKNGFAEIRAEQRAPRSMRDAAPDESNSESTPTTKPTR